MPEKNLKRAACGAFRLNIIIRIENHFEKLKDIEYNYLINSYLS